MIYANDDPLALYAMELERTGNYGDDDYDESKAMRCPVCGAYEPEYYYFDDDEECIGCTECVYRSDVLF